MLFLAPGAQSRLCVREKLLLTQHEEWPPAETAVQGAFNGHSAQLLVSSAPGPSLHCQPQS